MLAFCAFIFLLKFATCAVQIPAQSAPDYSSATMTDQTDTAASADRASMNYTKDAYGISPLATLSGINLNNRKVASQYYEDTRTSMIRRLQMIDGLYDLAVDFGSKSDSSVPWGASKKVKLKSYNNIGDKVGSTRTVGAIDRLTVRLRVQNIMLAHLPPDTSWWREINSADPKEPILTWFAKKDAFYLAPTRGGIHQSQSRYFGYRWRASMDLSDFIEEYDNRARMYERQNEEKLTPVMLRDQFYVALCDTEPDTRAEGQPHFGTLILTFKFDTSEITKDRLLQEQAQLLDLELDLRNTGVLPASVPFVQATSVYTPLPVPQEQPTYVPYIPRNNATQNEIQATHIASLERRIADLQARSLPQSPSGTRQRMPQKRLLLSRTCLMRWVSKAHVQYL